VFSNLKAQIGKITSVKLGNYLVKEAEEGYFVYK
jgi:hypothetical protein